jgi:rhamnosyltransferase
MKPTCSIVIRAYNEEAHLGRLLDGISHQTIKDVQVIVVDSGSKDRTFQIAQKYTAEVVKIDPKEFTFGRSLNFGISKANGEIVVIASAHVYPVYPDWLEKLIEPFKDKKVALTYGKQRGSNTSHFSENQIFTHWYPRNNQLNQRYPFCNNANAAIRRILWKKQHYDENLPALEDLAWAKWMIEKGFRIDYVAEAEIVHVHEETSKGIYNRYKREGMAFKQIYPHENFRLLDALRLFFTNVDSDMHEAYKQGMLGKQLLKILSFRRNQFWGTYQGYRQSGPLTWQLKRSFYYPRTAEPLLNGNPIRDIDPISYEKIDRSKKKNKKSRDGRVEWK